MKNLRTQWRGLAEKLQRKQPKNKILEVIKTYIVRIMISTYYASIFFGVLGFICFALGFSIENVSLSDFLIISGLVSWSPIAIYGIVAIINVWIIRPIKYITKKNK
mgnify:CR=1 FL=1